MNEHQATTRVIKYIVLKLTKFNRSYLDMMFFRVASTIKITKCNQRMKHGLVRNVVCSISSSNWKISMSNYYTEKTNTHKIYFIQKQK